MTSATRVPESIGFYMDSDAWPGGAELWLTHLMKGLKDEACDVSIVLTEKAATDPWASLLEESGVRVSRIRATRELDRAGVKEAAAALEGQAVVHVNKPHPRACLTAIEGARLAGASALVVSEHVVAGPRSRYPMGAAVVRRLVARANALADVITVPSDASRATYVEAYRPEPSKVVTVRGAVDLTLYGGPVDRVSVRRSLGLPDGARAAAVVGRLHEGKGLPTALRAVPIVRERIGDFHLVVVGEGDMRGELIALRDALGLSSAVHIVGARDDVPSVLKAVDLLIVPSESETAGLTAIEAGAAGRPVVATNVGGLPEAVLDGRTGVLVPARDERAIADAVVRIMSDAAVAAQMGEAGRKLVGEEFGRGRLVSRMAEVYAWALGGGPRSS